MGVELVSHPYRSWDKSKLINWDAIAAGTSASRRRQIAAQEVERCGFVSLTDASMNDDKGGVFVREILADEESGAMRDPRRVVMAQTSRRLFKLFWLRHQDGTLAKPGDKVQWKVGNLTHEPGTGKPMTTRLLRTMRRQGASTEFVHQAIIGDDGCIMVPFSDASLLLSKYGFQTAKYREQSSGRYNWLLWEVPSDEVLGIVAEPKQNEEPAPARRAAR
jgi:hypothetical protein